MQLAARHGPEADKDKPPLYFSDAAYFNHALQDFKTPKAEQLLNRYRNQFTVFNDDMQGPASRIQGSTPACGGPF